MEAQWEQRLLQQVTNDAEVVSKQMDRVMQMMMEMSECKQAGKVQKAVQDATTA
jgi:hypothetical protein